MCWYFVLLPFKVWNEQDVSSCSHFSLDHTTTLFSGFSTCLFGIRLLHLCVREGDKQPSIRSAALLVFLLLSENFQILPSNLLKGKKKNKANTTKQHKKVGSCPSLSTKSLCSVFGKCGAAGLLPTHRHCWLDLFNPLLVLV